MNSSITSPSRSESRRTFIDGYMSDPGLDDLKSLVECNSNPHRSVTIIQRRRDMVFHLVQNMKSRRVERSVHLRPR